MEVTPGLYVGWKDGRFDVFNVDTGIYVRTITGDRTVTIIGTVRMIRNRVLQPFEQFGYGLIDNRVYIVAVKALKRIA